MTDIILVSQKKRGTLDSSQIVLPKSSALNFLLSKNEQERTFSEIVQTDSPQKIHFRVVVPTGAVFSFDEFTKEMSRFRSKFVSDKILGFSYSTKNNNETVYDFVVTSHSVKNSIEMMTLAQEFNEKYTNKFEPGLSLDIYGTNAKILIYGHSEPEFSEGKKILVAPNSFTEEEILRRSLLTLTDSTELLNIKIEEIVHVNSYVNVPPPTQPVVSLPSPTAVHKNDNAVVLTPEPELEIPECQCADANEDQGDMIPESKKEKKKSKKNKKKSKKRGFLMTLLFGPKKSKKEKKAEKKEKADKKKAKADKKKSKSGFVFDFRVGREKKNFKTETK